MATVLYKQFAVNGRSEKKSCVFFIFTQNTLKRGYNILKHLEATRKSTPTKIMGAAKTIKMYIF